MFIRVLRGKISQQLRRFTASGDATLFFKQQLPAITQQFFQGNIFMTIAVTLPTIAVDPSASSHYFEIQLKIIVELFAQSEEML